MNTAPYYCDQQATLLLGDALTMLSEMPDASVNCIVTSPPYWGLRDYGQPGQYGLEDSPLTYVDTMRAVFGQARRVLAADGTLWLNLGDTYANRANAAASKSFRADAAAVMPARVNATAIAPRKGLLMVPERVAMALSDDGWILRNKIVWHKPNAMPQSVTDRLSGRYEHVFLFAKSPRYFFDLDAIREPAVTRPGRTWAQRKAAGEPGRHGLAGQAAVARGGFTAAAAGRNPGDVWALSTRPYPEAHFATFPIDLPLRCITAGSRPGDTVLDPFSGSGTTGAAAQILGRRYVGIDLNPGYHDLAITRLAKAGTRPANETPHQLVRNETLHELVRNETPGPAGPMRNETCCQAPRCGNPIPKASTGRPRRFCSPACRARAHRAGAALLEVTR